MKKREAKEEAKLMTLSVLDHVGYQLEDAGEYNAEEKEMIWQEFIKIEKSISKRLGYHSRFGKK